MACNAVNFSNITMSKHIYLRANIVDCTQFIMTESQDA